MLRFVFKFLIGAAIVGGTILLVLGRENITKISDAILYRALAEVGNAGARMFPPAQRQ